jgi:hypothetical protein
MRKERSRALALANAILDRPDMDPDDDLVVLARQLIRAQEEIELARGLMRAQEEIDAGQFHARLLP